LSDHGSLLASYSACCASQALRDQSESDARERAPGQALAEALATPFDKASAHPAALMTQRFSLPGRKARAAAAPARCAAAPAPAASPHACKGAAWTERRPRMAPGAAGDAGARVAADEAQQVQKGPAALNCETICLRFSGK